MVGSALTPNLAPGRHRRRPLPPTTGGARRRLTLGSTIVLALLAVGAAASALWTAHGHGDGAAATGNAAAVTLSPAAPDAQLRPGGSADAVLAISNPNPASVHIGSLALDTATGTMGFTADAAHAACDLSSLAFTTATNDGAGWTVPGAVDGADGTRAVTLPDAVAMSIDAPDPCQGVAVTVHLSAIP